MATRGQQKARAANKAKAVKAAKARDTKTKAKGRTVRHGLAHSTAIDTGSGTIKPVGSTSAGFVGKTNKSGIRKTAGKGRGATSRRSK